MKVLHIDSSIQGSGSATRELTREIVARLMAARPDAQVTYRDLAAEELPHFSHVALTRADELEAARNQAVLEEFLGADVLVIGAPLYNFSIPTQLKAWIDRIVIAGRTVTPSAVPKGLRAESRSSPQWRAEVCTRRARLRNLASRISGSSWVFWESAM